MAFFSPKMDQSANHFMENIHKKYYFFMREKKGINLTFLLKLNSLIVGSFRI